MPNASGYTAPGCGRRGGDDTVEALREENARQRDQLATLGNAARQEIERLRSEGAS